jgi:NADH:ubiquinone oxidoreductase subunit F (NADH-binding)/NADPH-dependent glutamate synthase beta subunit-like oxidoreductase/(2Fe-2S) ferredoxin
MERLKSIDDFKALQYRIRSDVNPKIPTIVISAGTCGQASGANDLIRVSKRELLSRRLTDKIRLRITGCQGFCQMEPLVVVQPYGTFYPRIGVKEMSRIVEAVAAGQVLRDLLYVDPETGAIIEKQDDIPFFARQTRTILHGNEKIDPIRIYDYIESGGYSALMDVLARQNPLWVIEQVKASGLRGRGGAGFLTGQKWQMLAAQRNGRGKFLVCNGDEGDPGAYMDRSVLEGNPHSIIEGMLIGAYGTGATSGVIYVRNEYPLAVKHLVIALRQANELGLLGRDILGTGFSFDIQMVKGAGAFVCGEETALIRSVEGKMGEPRQRPPYPVQKGIDGKPTAINNVETWANVPAIFIQGASEFAKIGTPQNTGTKIFSLVGKVRNTGLVEVPMGITINEIVNTIGGGPAGPARIKAVQTGGPSGGCIPAKMFDLPIDYESLARAGSIMGSGGMIVMDDNTCMVDVAKYFMNFLKDESCGKCFTCRKGTQRMWEILDEITRGKGTPSQLELLEELATVVKDTTMCGLGQTAANPVLSTLRYFRQEYEHHIREKRCGAFVCKDLVGAPCQSACPLGTEAWRYVAHLARGEYEEAYRVIRETNPFPSVCARVCDHKCESRCRLGTSGNRPVAIRALKRFITDHMDPSIFKARPNVLPSPDNLPVAVVGSGPAGLTAAHYLSLDGHRVTVFEADEKPGGMLTSGIPAYRLRRDVLQREIESLLDENITLKCNSALGRDFTVDTLFEQGYKAVFLAMGAHKSRRLNIEGEDLKGVYPAIQFLKAFNLQGKKLAKGYVGIIGGGNSAVDAARVALRQEGVSSVTLFYRRLRPDMPALKEEVDLAIEEGIQLETLVTPVKIDSRDGCLTGIQCVRNELGARDSSGRRHPNPIRGTEFLRRLDTLIITIGDEPDIDYMASMGIEINERGTLRTDPDTLATSRAGVFAGGDVVTGPNTVVDAIASGKKAAVMIGRYLRREKMKPSEPMRIPQVYVAPCGISEEEAGELRRAEPPTLPIELRKRSFSEVELPLLEEDARREAKRCLRCDLEFTEFTASEPELATAGVKTV